MESVVSELMVMMPLLCLLLFIWQEKWQFLNLDPFSLRCHKVLYIYMYHFLYIDQGLSTLCVLKSWPFHLQALTYRAGHHSTSDDSSKYRPVEEIEWWRETQNPVARFRKWLEREGWWTTTSESELRDYARQEVHFSWAKIQNEQNGLS